ncbi:MAG: 4-hydroxy-2-oxoheptanedioate aldolase [Paracoccaceae bacterium]|jgi:4-hydroxy-2-oxoheptanedioate aldolase
MKNPTNIFKAALKSGKHQLGIWNSIGGPTVVEHLAACGFDWVLIDTEHAPADVADVLPALQAIAGYPDVTAVVRPASNDAVLIKRILDFGAQTLLIPYVQSVGEAEAAVAAIRYAPRGIRGFAGMTRASRFGQVEDYGKRAEEELCLLIQVETQLALDQIEEIATVDGVDGIFIGPADLAASMGHPGNMTHPDVVNAIEDAFARLAKVNVPSGILSLDLAFSKHCIALGTAFTAVDMDLALLDRGARAIKKEFD